MKNISTLLVLVTSVFGLVSCQQPAPVYVQDVEVIEVKPKPKPRPVVIKKVIPKDDAESFRAVTRDGESR